MGKTTEMFVAEVARLLRTPDEERYQDQLDLLLLTGYVDATPIPRPIRDCQECDGCGRVCVCHGLPRFMLWPEGWRDGTCRGPTETCKCVVRQRHG